MKALSLSAAMAVFLATTIIAFMGLVAGAVRVLPWVLDPEVPWRVAGPFARGLAAVAMESALLAGWPLGWAVACFRLVESGQARVLQTLGERPLATIARLAPQGAAFAVALSAVAGIYGRDAGAPGRVATELLTRSRSACAVVTHPMTYAIPFTNLTWLCVPGRPPRLVGSLSGLMGSFSVVSAGEARIAGDFRAIQLEDARILLEGSPPLAVRVDALAIRGMPAWAQASTLPAPMRALVLSSSAWIAAWIGAYAVLHGAARTRVGVLGVGAVGPLCALGLMRLLERMSAKPLAFALVPVAGGVCTLGFAALLSRRQGVRALALRFLGRDATS